MTNPTLLTDQAIEDGLRGLRAVAPASVGFGALVEAGLADRYAPIDTPLGPVFVAWNGRGVSWVTPAVERSEFEDRFRAAVGREIDAAILQFPDCGGAA